MLLSEEFNKCVAFHGHTCPGLAIGFKAAQVLMSRLKVQKAPDEELVAIVETEACGADAIQVITGCTFGKGNFILRNYGKHAFSLLDRKNKKGIRVCLLPDVLKVESDFFSLSKRVQNDEATPTELERFRQIQQERTKKILEAEPESLFKIEEISPDIPLKARVVESEICDVCGEPAKGDLLCQLNGKKRCIPCSQKQQKGASV